MFTPTFGISIATYNKGLNFTHVVKRTLESILSQTYTNWKVYLIGDNYYPDKQFKGLTDLFPPDKIVAENLPVAAERSKMEGQNLWHHGGCNATNHSLSLQRRDKIEITTHLDHDDVWRPNHLETLHEFYNKFPESAFLYTRATHPGLGAVPGDSHIGYNNVMPRWAGVIHSTVSWKLDAIPLDYEIHLGTPGDADMWGRITAFCKKNDLKVLYVPKVTVNHFMEGL